MVTTTLEVHHVFDNPVFCDDDEDDEGYSEGLPVTNIVAEDSVVKIGNKVEFNGGVVILPDVNGQIPTTTTEHVFSGLQSGEVKAKNIDDELGKKRWSRTKVGLFLGIFGIVATIIISIFSSTGTLNCGDLISRAHWEAKPSTCKIPNYQKLPVLVLVYQTEKKNCKTCNECIEQVKALQKYQQNPWSTYASVRPKPACDIQYNFLVGGDGRIYEGRGFGLQGGMPDSFENQTFILAFMGNFIVKQPEDEQLAAAKKFLEKLAEEGHLDPDFRIAGAMQVRRSDSPGCELLNDLKIWKRWTENPLGLLKTSRTRNETFEDLCTRPPPNEAR